MATKQVLVVRKDLNMRKGKIAAQCAHAAMAVLLDSMQKDENLGLGPEPHGPYERLSIIYHKESQWAHWLNGGFAKIVVSVDSEEALEYVYAHARRLGIPAAMITDSGRTEFHGVPTKTVVAVGPDKEVEVDKVTGGLPLL